MKYMHSSLKCSYCGSSEIVFDNQDGVYVCKKCGTVLGRAIYEGYELRPFDNGLPRTSGSYTDTVHDHGIGSTDFDIKTSRVRKNNSYKWKNMHSLLVKTRTTKKEKIIEKALRHLNYYAKILETPDYVRETAARLLRKTVEGKNYKDKTLKNLALAAIYISFKIHGLHRPAKLYAKETGISLKKLWHAEKKIYEANGSLNMLMKKENPENYVTYIVNKLGLSTETEILANKLISEAKKLGIHIGRPAIGLATAAVYLASILLNEKKTQLEIAEVVGVSDVTIRNRYSDLVESLNIEVYI